MPDAYIGLGANLRRPRRQLMLALDQLRRLPDSRLLAVSPFFMTTPLPGSGGPNYCNAVARLGTRLRPLTLLDQLLAIERRLGRRRTPGRYWEPRPIDLDLLLYGRSTIHHPRLIVPHPGLRSRTFVLEPLKTIAPAGLWIPTMGRLADITASSEAEPYG